jgi:hypothetical protein
LNGGVQFVQGDVLKNWANATLGYYTDKWVNVLPFGSALTTFTINVWVNIGSGNTGNINLVSQTYSQDAIYTPEADCNFFIKGDGTGNGFNGGVRVSGNDFVMNSGGFTSGNWNNLTLTYDGGNLIMYVNGSPIIPFVVVPTPTSNGLDTLIGGSINGLSGGASTDYFNGRIGVVHIYDTALDSGQVTEIYNTYRTRF